MVVWFWFIVTSIVIVAMLAWSRRIALKGWKSEFPGGHCPDCGYDLRGHAKGARCPECGSSGAVTGS